MLLIKDAIINFLSFVFGMAVLTLLERGWNLLMPVFVDEGSGYAAIKIGLVAGVVVYPLTIVLLLLSYKAAGTLSEARLQASRTMFWTGVNNAVLVTGAVGIMGIISVIIDEGVSVGFMEMHARYIVVAGLACFILRLLDQERWTKVQAY